MARRLKTTLPSTSACIGLLIVGALNLGICNEALCHTETAVSAEKHGGGQSSKSKPVRITVSQIVIAFAGSPLAQASKKALTESEAKAKAERIREQLIAGASFEKLARDDSDDTVSGSRGG